MNQPAQTLTMAISYWGYIALLPALIIGFIVGQSSWPARRKD